MRGENLDQRDLIDFPPTNQDSQIYDYNRRVDSKGGVYPRYPHPIPHKIQVVRPARDLDIDGLPIGHDVERFDRNHRSIEISREKREFERGIVLDRETSRSEDPPAIVTPRDPFTPMPQKSIKIVTTRPRPEVDFRSADQESPSATFPQAHPHSHPHPHPHQLNRKREPNDITMDRKIDPHHSAPVHPHHHSIPRDRELHIRSRPDLGDFRDIPHDIPRERDPREARDGRDPRDVRDIEAQDIRVGREPIDIRDPRDRNSREAWDTKGPGWTHPSHPPQYHGLPGGPPSHSSPHQPSEYQRDLARSRDPAWENDLKRDRERDLARFHQRERDMREPGPHRDLRHDFPPNARDPRDPRDLRDPRDPRDPREPRDRDYYDVDHQTSRVPYYPPFEPRPLPENDRDPRFRR